MAKKKSGIASKAAQKVADKKAQEKASLNAKVVKHVVEEPKVEVVEVKKEDVPKLQVSQIDSKDNTILSTINSLEEL